MTDKKTTDQASRFSKVAENVTRIRSQPEQPSPISRPSTAPKMGRPPGKKSNPDYTQVTVYLRKEVHQTARKLLIDESRQFSDLVDQLVSQWNEDTQKSR